MDITIIMAPKFPDLAEGYVVLSSKGKPREILQQNEGIYPAVLKDQILSLEHNEWRFLCLNVEHCFADDFTKNLAKLSKGRELYMFAINTSVDGLWFEYYKDGRLLRHWIEVEYSIEGNMGDYLPAEQALDYPFIDEAYEDVGQEMIYEMIYEITGFDITETF